MRIWCPCCGNECEVDGNPAIGQHMRCPFCSEVFSYSGNQHNENDSECACEADTTKLDPCPDECDAVELGTCNGDFAVYVSHPVEEMSSQRNHPNTEVLADISAITQIKTDVKHHRHRIMAILLTFGIIVIVITSILTVIHFTGAKDISEADHSVSRTIATEESAENKKEQKEHLRNQEAEGLYRQGIRHFYGDGALKDYNRAFKCFSDASKLGFLQADARLAACYLLGQGCEKDSSKSFRHASKAENCHDIEESQRAKLILGYLFFEGFADPNSGLERHSFDKAYNYFSSITTTIFCHATYLKGLMEYHGVGTMKDAAKAADTFYKLATVAGVNQGRAAMCLGMLYYNGEGVSKDYKEAWKWLWKGAKKAFPDLVKTAKAPLTKDDLYEFRKFTRGERSYFTPYTLKMYRLYRGEGVIKSHNKTLDLLESALRTMFQPGLWEMTDVEYTRENM